ncbi:MAG: hypothetical protein ACE5JB_05755 [bacterium]
MANNFYVTNSSVVFVYNRAFDIRKRIFEFEKSLDIFFKVPFNMYPVPEEADGNIPRFEAESISGHSRLQVSQFRLTFATNYSKNFSTKLESIREYISKRVLKLKNLVSSENIQFVAYILQLKFIMEKDEINDYLKNNTGIKALSDKTVDFSLLYSFPLKSKYYLNVKSSKYIEEMLSIDPEKRIATKTGEKQCGIGVTLDMNTKYYNQQGKDFKFGLIDEIEKDIFQIIQINKLQNYLTGELV